MDPSSLVPGSRRGGDSTTEQEEEEEDTEKGNQGLGPGCLALRAKRIRYLLLPSPCSSVASVSLWFDSTVTLAIWRPGRKLLNKRGSQVRRRPLQKSMTRRCLAAGDAEFCGGLQSVNISAGWYESSAKSTVQSGQSGPVRDAPIGAPGRSAGRISKTWGRNGNLLPRVGGMGWPWRWWIARLRFRPSARSGNRQSRAV